MSARRRQRESVAPSLFPFLAVLLCTMGSLVLILMLIVSGAQASARKVADQAIARQEEIESTIELAKSSYTRQLKEGRLEIEQKRLTLQHFEEHIQELLTELGQLEQKAQLLRSETESSEEDLARNRDAISELEKQLADAQEKLETQLAKPDGDKPIFAVIPYQGSNGTHRRPIYVECVDDGIIIQPEGIRLTARDLQPPHGPGNPLDAALRAIRTEYRPADGALTSTAYPLLIVRPSGIRSYTLARSAMNGWDDQFGYELVSEELELVFPESKPGLQQRVAKSIELARSRQQALVSAMPRRFNGYERLVGGAAGGSGNGSGGTGSGSAFGGGSGDYANSEYGSGKYGKSGYDNGRYGPGQLSSAFGPGGDLGSPGSGSGYTSGASTRAQSATFQSGTGGGQSNGSGTSGQSLSGSSFDPTRNRSNDYANALNSAGGSLSNQEFSNMLGSLDAQNLAGNRDSGTGNSGTGNSGGTSFFSDGAQGGVQGGTQSGSQGNFQDSQLRTGSASQNAQGNSEGSTGGQGGQSQASGSGGSASPQGASPSSAGGMPGNAASADSQQSGPSPPSLDLSNRSETAQAVASSRGRNWAWSRGPAMQTPVVRSIHLHCFADRWILLPDDGNPAKGITIKFDQPPEARAVSLAKAVSKRVDSWGLALTGGYWRPVLVVDVTPNAKWRYEQLQQLMDGSGIEIKLRERTK